MNKKQLEYFIKTDKHNLLIMDENKIKYLFKRLYYKIKGFFNRLLDSFEKIESSKHASKFVIISLLWLCLLLCIEIFKRLI
jgi:hypothetical protein|tara:strand:+ start:1230 stop:1472 length:243 start_codon:yes stop_codon:yes gene_type:complete